MDERAETVRRLIDDSARGVVDLTVLSALELCALGATGQAVFDAPVAEAWGALADDARATAASESRAGLVRRRLTGPAGDLAAELSVAMAARANPTFALVTELDGVEERSLKMFGLGDEEEPLRAVVLESPIAAPAGHRSLQRMGPLGWFYRYTLASRAIAAGLLVRWTELALPRKAKGRVITTFRHSAGSALTGDVVTISGKGKLTLNGELLDATTLREVVGGLVTAS
jgi:hypothetical protein